MRNVLVRAAALALSLGPLALAPGGAAAPRPVVLFDEAHGQLFHARGERPLDLSGLARLVGQAGGAFSTAAEPVGERTLEGVTALVVSGPFRPFAVAESERVVAFVEAGGALAVMLHIEPPVADLLHRLGVSVSNGVILERENVLDEKPQDFRVTRLRPHPLTNGLGAFALHGVWALLPTGGGVESLAETSPRAWIDLNRSGAPDQGDAVQAFSVLVAGARGKGRFAVLGDDAVFQNQFLSGGNRRLAENLVRWLLGASGAPAQRACGAGAVERPAAAVSAAG